MALDRLTKIDGGGISTTSDYRVGVITATKFVGPIEGSITSTDANFSGNVTIGGTLTYEDVTNIDSVGLVTARDGIDCNGDLDVDGHTNLDNVSVAGVTTFSDDVYFDGATANRDIVFDRSANTLHVKNNAILKIGEATGTTFSNNGANTQITHSPIGSFYVAANTFQVFGSGTRSGNTYDNTLLRLNNGVAELGHEIPNGGASGFKLATSAKGITVGTGVTIETNGQATFSGITTFTDNINIDADNKKLQIGDSQDLELFHNGTNSVINNTEGALLFQNNGSSSMYIASDGQVSLNNDITFIGASANALWDKSENYFSIPDKIVHSGDTNTAIRFPTNDQIQLETNGIQWLNINSTGAFNLGNNSVAGAKVYIKNGNDNANDTNALALDIQGAWMRIGDAILGNETFNNGVGIKFHNSGTVHWTAGILGSGFYISNTSNNGNQLFPSSRTDAFFLSSIGNATFSNNVTVNGNLSVTGTTALSSTVFIPDSIVHDGDTNTKIRFPANDTFSVETAGAEAFRIDSGGVATLKNKLIIDDGSNGHLFLNNTSSDNTIHSGTTGFAAYKNLVINAAQHIFKVSNSEKLRITSDGKIGIGEDDPDGNFLLIRAASTVGTNKGHIMLTGDSATNGQGPQIVFSESGSGSNFAGAYIGHAREGSNSTGNLVFATRETGGDANTVPTERLRIAANGNITFTGPSNSFATIEYASNFTKLDLRGNGIANSYHYILSYGAGHGSADDFHMVNKTTNGGLVFRTGSSTTERLRIGSEGNLALGGTNTSAYANQAHLFIGGVGNLYGDNGVGSGKSLSLSNNAYINTSGNWVYRANDKATNIYQYDGIIGFRTATSGTAGNTISWSERLRITSGGNLSIGNIHSAKKVHISTTGNQKILIDPNFNNNSGGSANSEADANNIVESILIRTSFGSNAASQTNAGHKWGIKFQGYNGNDFTQATAKCAGVFAVSEDEATGYNKNVGLAFHTSPYNTAHREVMRINTNGIVTKPYQYAFLVATSNHQKTANWSHITNHSIYSSQCTGVSDGTYWSNSTQRFTAPVTGVYNFYVGGWSYGNSNGSRYAYSFKHQNDNSLLFIGGGDYCSGDSPMAGWSRVIKLTAGEWVELWGYSAIAVRWGGGHRFFWGGYLLG